MTGLPPEFADAAFAEPEDDTPRLAAADWLEEHGRPECGEFVRLQCELARPGVPEERAAHLNFRCRSLRKRHAASWLAPLAPLQLDRGRAEATFVRGFLDELVVYADITDADLSCLAHAPLVSRLSVRAHNRLTFAGLAALAGCRGLTALRLRQRAAELPWEALAPLVTLPRLLVREIAGPGGGNLVIPHRAAIRAAQRPLIDAMSPDELCGGTPESAGPGRASCGATRGRYREPTPCGTTRTRSVSTGPTTGAWWGNSTASDGSRRSERSTASPTSHALGRAGTTCRSSRG